MEIIEALLQFLAYLSIAGTVASLLRFDDWWIRAFDFPRVQLLVFSLFSLVGWPLAFGMEGLGPYLMLVALIISVIYQATKIWPYTPLASQQVQVHQGPVHSDNAIALLMSNVLQTNQNSAALLQLIRQQQPDIVLTLETNGWWEKELSVIESDYPHTVKVPLENLYGMHLYSRLPLFNTEVRFQVKEDIPSILTHTKLPSGEKVRLFCVHPMPPSPTESYSSTGRDAELLMVGKEVSSSPWRTIVAGDLNDVAWSYTTRLFQRISHLLDPRRGRGFFSTFHAKYWFFRWPLDHIFHSSDFRLIEMKRLMPIDSDHFPMYARLQFDPAACLEQIPEQADAAEKQEAEEKINNGLTGEDDTVINALDKLVSPEPIEEDVQPSTPPTGVS